LYSIWEDLLKRAEVYITCIIPQPAIDYIKTYYSIDMNLEDRILSGRELIENVKNRHAVLCLLTDTIDRDVLDAAGQKCRIFANYAVGYNNIDVKAATDLGIVITNTPGVLDNATADLAWTLLFAVSRRIIQSDRFVRSGQFKSWGPMLFLGRDITNKTVGIVGAGRIGSNFARKAKAFGMKILYTDHRTNPQLEQDNDAEFVDKKTLLKKCDFISLHVPLTPETEHYISKKELKMMKREAVLINTSRGSVVDEKALVQALRNKEIWGAGLDVYENEPDLEPGLAELDNVVLLSHIGSATIETRTNMGLIAAKNIVQVLNGEKPENCVNPEVLGKF
jgi:glyoxylate reductase